jgi:predicted Zn-dependent peptidase
MIMGFFGNKLGDETGWTEDVLSVILGGGMSSRLFTEVREKRGLAYTVRTSPDHFLDAGSFSTYAGVDTTKAHEALKVILDEHMKLAQKKVSAEELKKAKEFLKGHFALSLESTKAISDFFGHDRLLLDKFHTPEEEIAHIEEVTAEEIQSLAQKLFVKENLNLAVIGPFDDKIEFEKILSL